MTTIFITIPWFFPAYKAGGPVQSIINMVEEFRDDVTYNIFCGDADLNNEPLSGIKKDQWVAYNAYTQVWYASKDNRSNHLLAQVEKIKPDVLYIVGLFSWHFNIVPLFFCKLPKKILSVRGMLHTGALTQKKTKKQFFLQALKLSGVAKKIVFHATDAAEKKQIQQNFSADANIIIASNFPRLIGKANRLPKEKNTLQLTTIALISPMKNHLLVLQALALVKEKITYNIYGPIKDILYWQQCFNLIQQLPENITVQHHGDVQPVLVPALLHRSDVFIMPSKSENFGHSLIEALSAGVPVITSTYTPWNDLQVALAGYNVPTSAAEIADIISLFAQMDHTEWETWSAGALAYTAAHVHTDAVKKDYETLFKN